MQCRAVCDCFRTMSRRQTPFTNLLLTTRRACDSLAPMVREIYALANTAEARTTQGADEALIQMLKMDASVFTIADGLVQAILTRAFFRGCFANVVGEEDSADINFHEKPFHVGNLRVPSSLDATITKAVREVETLSAQLDAQAFTQTTVFIDPIDGTKEFTSNLGEHCTIMIGFVEAERPVAGLIYRPISTPSRWVAGCRREDFYEPAHLDLQHQCNTTTSTAADPAKGFLTSNGIISPFIKELIEELGMERVKAGGVGNKVMCLLEGKASCYIQDRGVSRWDTAAPQAVLEASNGVLLQVRPFLDEALEPSVMEASYEYKVVGAGDVNADLGKLLETSSDRFHPICTKHNMIDPENAQYKELLRSSQPSVRITRVAANLVKPYANLCGLFALRNNTPEEVNKYVQALQTIAQREPPTFS